MKKLNATNAIAILSLGLTLSVVVAGCGGGNDTAESAVTKNAKAGSSDGGAGGGSTTSDTKTGISDGGTGESVTVSDSELRGDEKTCMALYDGVDVCTTLTKVQMNALTSAQWETVDGLLQASQVASIPTKTIKNLSTAALEGLTTAGTQALTTEQLNSMSKDQLNALVSSGELTDTQLVTVNTRLKKLG